MTLLINCFIDGLPSN